jgi:hypothetical protein
MKGFIHHHMNVRPSPQPYLLDLDLRLRPRLFDDVDIRWIKERFWEDINWV